MTYYLRETTKEDAKKVNKYSVSNVKVIFILIKI